MAARGRGAMEGKREKVVRELRGVGTRRVTEEKKRGGNSKTEG